MSNIVPAGNGHAVSVQQPSGTLSAFSSIEAFENGQRMAKALAASAFVPEAYRGDGGIGNCLIAMEVASRTGASILAVVQNLDVIEGRPGWRSQFIIAAINSCGRFAPLRYDLRDAGRKSLEYEFWTGPKGNRSKQRGKMDLADRECIAWTTERGFALPPNIRTLEQARAAEIPVLESPPVSLAMAVSEGWYHRTGSKWQTMPELMLRYRAAAFFGRLYAPDILMGMSTAEEVEDIRAHTATPIDAQVVETASPRPGLSRLDRLADTATRAAAPSVVADDIAEAIEIIGAEEGREDAAGTSDDDQWALLDASGWVDQVYTLGDIAQEATSARDLEVKMAAPKFAAPYAAMKRHAPKSAEAVDELVAKRREGLGNG